VKKSEIHPLWLRLTVIIATLYMAPVAADLKATVGWLQQEPMSLFDWGMYRLERELQRVRRDDRDFLRVVYQPDKGRILIDASFVVLPAEIASITAKTACYTRHHAIKLLFGVIDTSVVNLAPESDYRLGLKFSHQDPETIDQQPDAAAIGRDLMQSIFIRVAISSEKMEFPFSPDMRCHGRLMSQDVSYSSPDDDD
jgi:hypothetical protein